MIKSERNGSLITIVFDHYTIKIDECRGIDSLDLSDDREKEELDRQKMAVRDVMNGTRSVSSLDFGPISEFSIEAISDCGKQFVIFCANRNEWILIDYKNPNNCKYVEPDISGPIKLKSLCAFDIDFDFNRNYKEVNSDNEPFIKKEVFIILNDRILMYHLPFMGKVFEYMLNEDVSSKQIHICVDYARIKGSILQQAYDGLTLDDKPLPVKAANECELIAKLDHVAYDYMNEVVVKGSDGKEIYIETYCQNVAFVNDPDIRIYWYAELNDVVSGEIKEFKVGRCFDHNRFIYQTAN